ncbi:MAG: helix-turn-helix domain-containing protein [Heliobacteriaceae bacterium]|jgi:transcriptional regulator with XRE-family HTH domain|nr:helix-turn-helix domain-containing protein [Heliobacteriaceae bacterium]
MWKDDFLKLGHKIKFERTRRKMSQLALALKTGLTTRSVSRIECGTNDPRYSTLMRIAQAFDMELSDLFNFRL